MSLIITDGTGTGKVAKVNKDNRLNVNAETLGAREVAVIKGEAFFLEAQSIELTSDNPSAIFYYKNTGIEDVLVVSIITNLGVSTGGGSGLTTTELLRNPTTGTIVTNEVTTGQKNFNFGSSKQLAGDIFAGVEGDTFTDGESFTEADLPTPLFLVSDTVSVIPPGSSLGFRFTPPTGNTSMTVGVAISVYLDGFGE